MTTQLYQHHRYPSRQQQQQQQQQQPITQSNYHEHSESESEAESTGSDSDDSDDIPLGQRHPDALKAQATIRAERAKRRQQQQQEQELARAATIAKLSMKSTGVPDEDDNQPLGLIKRMKSMAKPIKNNLLPPPPSSSSTVFSVEELIKKLDLVQQQAIKPSVLIHSQQQQQQQQLGSQTHHTTQTINTHHTNIPHPRPARLDSNSGSQSRKPSDHFLTPLSPSFQEHPQQLPLPIQRPSERTIPKSPIEQQRDLIDPSRHISSSVQQQQQATLLDNKSNSLPDQIRRSPIHHRGHTDQHTHHHHEPTPSNALRRAKSTVDKPGTFHSFHNAPPTEPLPTLPSHINQHPHHHQHHHHQQRQEPESRSPIPTRPTKLLSPIDTKFVGPFPGGSPLASPIETSSPSHPIPLKKILIKLAIVHQSQSIMVEIDPFTTVKDLIDQAQQTGELNDELFKGSWGVFEVWKDLGIERPIREIETILSVVETWTSADTNETHLLIQKNDLSGLAVSKRSFTSGVHGGNLWCELKPGKWTKKYVLLRDNELYLCSNDKGKDEMFLCTMEKFDVYAIPCWAHKTLKGVPRDYSFGLKSLNKLSFFETKSDFIHKFSCKNRLVLLEWIRRLYDARSYIVMSQRGEDEPTTVGLNRTKSTRSGGLEKVKSVKVKRSGTVSGGRGQGGMKEAIPAIPERGARKESTGSGGGSANGSSGLSRRPTLIQTGSSTRFRQGTLLGDLSSAPPPPPKHHNLTDDSSTPTTTTLQAVLPAHILALSSSPDPRLTSPRENAPGIGSGRSSSQPAATSSHAHTPTTATSTAPTTSTTTIKVRTWEQMGSEERKLYLTEVQNKAKLEGRTLLQFDNNPVGSIHNNHTHHHTSTTHSSHSTNAKEPLISSVPSPSSFNHHPSSFNPSAAASPANNGGLKRSMTTGASRSTRSPSTHKPSRKI
ncbi:hypothetical protein PGT21_021998 [Puccinia graminis f. sp. tritici]|nr:hypothetical protein PGT21_021998 [Puccinia graminis f. sp. tritici]